MPTELDYAQQQEVKALAKEIHRLNNQMSSSDPALALLADELINDHRTLQQGLMRSLIVPMLRQWAQDFENHHYDLRNEATVRAASLMVKAMDAGKLQHFPFI